MRKTSTPYYQPSSLGSHALREEDRTGAGAVFLCLDAGTFVCYATRMDTPQWAIDLIAQVCADEGVRTPRVRFRRAKPMRGSMTRQIQRESHGEAYSFNQSIYNKPEINIVAGYLEYDQKFVLLHELAHWIIPFGHRHDRVFWDKAFALYHRYGIDGNYAIDRERSYREGAKSAYNRSAFVTQQGLQPEYVMKTLNRQCDCLCHFQKVKA